MLRLVSLLSLVCSLLFTVTVSAQSGEVIVPSGYGPVISPPVISPPPPVPAGSPLFVPLTHTRGRDRLRELNADRRFQGTTLHRLLVAAVRLNLDEGLVMALDQEGRARALAALDAVENERGVSLGLGISAIVMGVGSLLAGTIALLVGSLPTFSCSWDSGCTSRSRGVDFDIIDGALATGGVALALAIASISVAIDTGSQRRGWGARLSAGGFVTDAGVEASMAVSGTF